MGFGMVSDVAVRRPECVTTRIDGARLEASTSGCSAGDGFPKIPYKSIKLDDIFSLFCTGKTHFLISTEINLSHSFKDEGLERCCRLIEEGVHEQEGGRERLGLVRKLVWFV